jgi:glycerol-3-phosphate dehydrogenase
MQRNLSALADREFDLVVVGGGVCGAAVAWDGALRGLSVALLERTDFGSGTSAESLKVVHGGIRYLQHLDVARVRESSRERAALLRIAPHLVYPMPFVVPTYGYGMRGAEALGAAFVILQALTATRNRGIADPDRHIPRARLVGRQQLLDWFPQVDTDGLRGAGMFWDGQMYNPPRLVWEFVRSAGHAGAVAANYCDVRGLIRAAGRVTGVRVEDRLGGEQFDVRGRVVVNAAGPFAEQLYVRDGLRQGRQTPYSRDMAIVVNRALVERRALALQTRYRDPDALLSRGARHIFLVPWRDRTLIGVNSAIYRGDPYALTVTEPEVQSFLDEINEADPGLRLTLDDVGLVMAGLLPIDEGELVGGNVSFGKRPLVTDNAATDNVDGLVTAVTNRYTVARGAAAHAVDLAFRKLGRRAPECRTAETPLVGGRFERFEALVRDVGAAAPELDGPLTRALAHNHGALYSDVLRLAKARPEWAAPLGRSTVLGAEVIHAIREEMAQRLTDCVFRRTDLGTGGDPGAEALEACADLAAVELGWSPDERAAQLADVRRRFPRGNGNGGVHAQVDGNTTAATATAATDESVLWSAS